ncbi:MAG: N-acetyltransferase [Paludibacteraceae bacterium]|nr:N-acetyltransferase [Paludibacteraceae bacterium]MBQ8715065.1 N-acetyltransferase [Prevotella sp.]
MTQKNRIIRKTVLPDDAERIMEVFAAAKGIMRASGNMNQWGGGYPSLEMVKTDVEHEGSFVIEDHSVIVGYFAFLASPEQTYSNIYNGQWTNDAMPYHVIHRIASVPEAHGVFKDILDFCFSQDKHIRIDTHRDNHIMRHNIEKYGFRYCGIIYLANGDERLAYDMIKTDP